MAPEKCIMDRLAFIKYLYNCAVEQSEKPEPICAASILTFHDAVELFLQLAAEYTNAATKNDTPFMVYWEKISDKLPEGQELTQKESMRRLNRSRVDLKHYGTRPIKLDIEGFRASATNFFVENTLAIFGIEFADISLIELVQYENVKEDLSEAENALNGDQIEDALGKVAFAFSKLIDDYERRKRDEFGSSPFFFGVEMESPHVNTDVNIDDDGEYKNLSDHIDTSNLSNSVGVIADTINSIQNAMKILSLGIDYRRYAKFRLLTPKISKRYGKVSVEGGTKRTPTADDVQFCITFVIESALILQEFDFEMYLDSEFRKKQLSLFDLI